MLPPLPHPFSSPHLLPSGLQYSSSQNWTGSPVLSPPLPIWSPGSFFFSKEDTPAVVLHHIPLKLVTGAPAKIASISTCGVLESLKSCYAVGFTQRPRTGSKSKINLLC